MAEFRFCSIWYAYKILFLVFLTKARKKIYNVAVATLLKLDLNLLTKNNKKTYNITVVAH